MNDECEVLIISKIIANLRVMGSDCVVVITLTSDPRSHIIFSIDYRQLLSMIINTLPAIIIVYNLTYFILLSNRSVFYFVRGSCIRGRFLLGEMP